MIYCLKYLKKCKKKSGQQFFNRGKNFLIDMVKLAANLNASSGFSSRTPEQLRNCWDNLKKAAKTSVANKRKKRFLTENPLLSKVKGLIDVVDGLPNAFNSDATFRVDVLHNSTDNDKQKLILVDVVDNSSLLQGGLILTSENFSLNLIDWFN
ncbi:hypothetical protein PUN28_008216 [Cardiocondyla obscurior]|uniref:Myb/SANT-like domain-containing protein n=1 Tax=Cardiocondyla obscurior TaxID=286306 RepID=A0AAW2FX71_9HYME